MKIPANRCAYSKLMWKHTAPIEAKPMQFDRPALEQAFARIGRRALEAGKLVEIAIDGGSALVLTLPARVATKDVDAIFEKDAAWIRHVAAEIGEELGWPAGWLNDAVKRFLSVRDEESDARRLHKAYPSERDPGLRVFVASAHYLFAMKCLAMRIGGIEEIQDRADIEAPAQHLGIRDAAAAMEVVSEYYPRSRISAKTQFGVEEIFGGPEKDQPA
jgi:hypothetical protein